MTASCEHPIAWEAMVAYWAGDLGNEDADAVEAHLMGCSACTATSARVAAVTEGMRNLIPVVVSGAHLDVLRARGLRIEENVIRPDRRTDVLFRGDVDLLVHRLSGLDLSRTQSVRVVVSVESTGDVMAVVPDAPFDRDTGEVMVACQRHFAAFPPDVVIEVETLEADHTHARARYTVPHTFEMSP